MIQLLKFEGYNIVISPEALMLVPFRKIWERDKSKDKSKALLEITFIYFIEDPRSDYQYLVDRNTRQEEIIKGIGLPSNWKPDKLIKEACELYSSFKPMSAGLLEDTRYFVNNLRKKLRTMDFDEKDDKGKPIYTLSSITETINKIPILAKNLDEAERTLSKDITNEAKARGAQTKALLEDED